MIFFQRGPERFDEVSAGFAASTSHECGARQTTQRVNQLPIVIDGARFLMTDQKVPSSSSVIATREGQITKAALVERSAYVIVIAK